VVTPDCQTCGACCTDQVIPIRPGDVVPVHLVGNMFMRQEHGRCAALTGQVGIGVYEALSSLRRARASMAKWEETEDQI